MKSVVGEVLGAVLIGLVVFLAVRVLVQNYRVEGGSMQPTLLGGQYLLVSKAAYWSLDGNSLSLLAKGETQTSEGKSQSYVFGPPERGDVVVFKYPLDPQRDFVKRVVGLAGDRVRIGGGKVYVNDIPLEEPYVMSPPQYDMATREVPAGHVFVLGDNRNHSSDSHIWGTVPMDNLLGKALVCYWPPEHWRFISTSSPLAASDSH